jgi:hypothetical protein
MRKLLIRWFQQPVLRLANRYSSRPDRERIDTALTDLLSRILAGERDKGLVIPFDSATGKFIIFSDQHKGRRNGADDFMLCEPNYLAALDYYYQNGFHLVALGDSEELWENSLASCKKRTQTFFRKRKAVYTQKCIYKNFWQPRFVLGQ